MSSTNKTEVLRLNQWISSDKPKREDFNYDNQVIENNFNYHTSDKFIHITQGERQKEKVLKEKTGICFHTAECITATVILKELLIRDAPLKCPLQWYLPITDRWL